MKFIDTHTHLQDFSEKCTDNVVLEAMKVGVEKFICVSSKPNEWRKVIGLEEKYPSHILSALGIHPWFVSDSIEEDVLLLEQLLQKNKNLLVGEIGLDGYKEAPERQAFFLLKQLELAKKYKRPVIIHCVKAQGWFENNWSLLPEKFVFHSYNGKADFAKKIVQKGGYVSFSFSILKNMEREEILKAIPIDKMLLETDSPYQAQEKSVENQPSFLPKLAFEVAKILEVEYEAFTKKIYENAVEFMSFGYK